MNTSWWLATLGRTLIWAQLRALEGGTAQVLDSDGQLLVYDSVDTARSMLLDADFVAFDGLDEADAQARGFDLAGISPPRGESPDVLVPQMVVSLRPSD